MVGMVDVVIPVDAEAAAALSDERKREAVGRIVSRILRPQPDHDPLVEAMERLGPDEGPDKRSDRRGTCRP